MHRRIQFEYDTLNVKYNGSIEKNVRVKGGDCLRLLLYLLLFCLIVFLNIGLYIPFLKNNDE